MENDSDINLEKLKLLAGSVPIPTNNRSSKRYKIINDNYFIDDLSEYLHKCYDILKFYKKNGVKVKFRLKNKQLVEGNVIKFQIKKDDKLNYRPRGYISVIIENELKIHSRIFLEDIDYLTILPYEVKETFDNNLRLPLSPKLRFEVFQRDNFRCRYCGRTSNETKLEVDHINPKSKGGSDDMDNLITSCMECNRGKGSADILNS